MVQLNLWSLKEKKKKIKDHVIRHLQVIAFLVPIALHTYHILENCKLLPFFFFSCDYFHFLFYMKFLDADQVNMQLFTWKWTVYKFHVDIQPFSFIFIFF